MERELTLEEKIIMIMNKFKCPGDLYKYAETRRKYNI